MIQPAAQLLDELFPGPPKGLYPRLYYVTCERRTL